MANAVRGEVAVKIGDVEIVLAATMDGLAQLSAAMGNPLFPELFQRLVGTEIVATRLAIRQFTIRGTDAEGMALDRAQAIEAGTDAFMLDDLSALQDGFRQCFDALMRGRGGKAPVKNA